MEKRTKRLEDWEAKIIQVNLDYEIYPNDSFPERFFLATKSEIKNLMELTKRRIKKYNTKIKPKSWAGYSEYGGTKQ